MRYNSTTTETEKQVENEERLEGEIKTRWQPLKTKNLRLVDAYERIGLEGRAERAADCGTFLQFRMEPNGAKLAHANFCRDRLCPMCNKRRSLKVFGQASQIMDYLCKHGKYRYVFLTLTVRNCSGEQLNDNIEALLGGFRWLSHKCRDWRRSVLGSMRSIEVTRNPVNGTWHPHIHCILAVPPAYFDRYSKYWIPQKRWAELWQQAVKSVYEPIVYVEAVKDERSRSGILNELSGGADKQSRADRRRLLATVTEDARLSAEYRAAVARASQYMSKDGSSAYLGAEPEVDNLGQLLNPQEILSNEEIDANVRTLLEGISGRRLIGWTGCFREARKALALDDAESGDLVHIDADAVREDITDAIITYRWRTGVYIRG